jgi:hypothetical protein
MLICERCKGPRTSIYRKLCNKCVVEQLEEVRRLSR